jgi:hydroxymethylpyrimidine pyrophosphatase-like HAD family hydrolase
MMIAFDLDNIVCTPIHSSVNLNGVENCTVLTGAKEALDKLKKLGHNIMIFTRRDLSLGPSTHVWLQKNKISYDYLICGKPNYDILIDPQTFKFSNWEEFFKTYQYRLESR